MPTLKRCAHCGGLGVLRTMFDRFYVQCGTYNCRIRTPEELSEEIVVNVWNKRVPADTALYSAKSATPQPKQ